MEHSAHNYTWYLVGTVDIDYWSIAYWINIFQSTVRSEYSDFLSNHTYLALGLLEIPEWMGMAGFDGANKKSKSSCAQDLCKSLALVTSWWRNRTHECVRAHLCYISLF